MFKPAFLGTAALLCGFSLLAHANDLSPGPIVTVINNTSCNPEELPICADSPYLDHIKEGLALNFNYGWTFHYQNYHYEFGTTKYEIVDSYVVDLSKYLGYDWEFKNTSINPYLSYYEVYTGKSCDYSATGLAAQINQFLNQSTVSHIMIFVTFAEGELYPGGEKEIVLECRVELAEVAFF